MTAVALLVVAALVGAGGYFGLRAASGTAATTPTPSCVPVSFCRPSTSTDDVTLFIPYTPGFGQRILSVAVGQQIPATVGLRGGETASSFSINWGDGPTQTNGQGTFAHTYSGLGEFLVYATALVGAVVHTGSSQYFPLITTQSIGNLSLGYFPTLNATFSNGTVGGLYPWLAAGGTVTLGASYAVPPTDAAYVPQPPSLTSTGGVQSGLVTTASSAAASYTFSNPGTYSVTFVGPVKSGARTVYQNYTWEITVYGTGALVPSCSACSTPTARSPHPGVLNIIEGGGPPIGGLDPAYDYDTVGAEPIWNIFETLVAYNGNQVGADPGSYVPELATCVPGSARCGALYPSAPGTDLIVNSGGAPRYWTFVIDKNARFYDPSTGNPQSVYPADVMFSVARAMAYENLPGVGYYNGFILGQAMLPTGNASWDSGIHFPFNNTAANVLGSMLINDTRYCPATAISGQHGCITFNAWGGNVAWPNFLQLIVDPLGGSVVECSYYVHLGVQPPGFSAGAGNVPCGLPGGLATNTTNSTLWTAYLATLLPTSWDAYERSGGSNYPAATPATRTLAAGSGPYRLVSANFQIGYVLQANPYYVQPTGCVGQANCLPAPPTIVPRVNVEWLLTDQQGIADYEAGYADLATIYPSDTTSLLALLQKGLVVTKTAPTLNIGFLLMNLEINLPAFRALDIYPTNIQANTFSYIGLRDFLATTISYATVESTLNTVDGIQYLFNYGGFIPQYMANYYPSNVSYPNYNVTSGQFTNPVTSPSVVRSMGWYWAQLTNPASNLYDPQFGAGAGKYNPGNPLEFPLIGEIGNTPLDSTYRLMASTISTATGGAIKVDTFDLSFSQIGANIGAPGATGLGFWNLAWAPDYANPWDYAVPLVLPDGTYTGPDAVAETFAGAYGGKYANVTDPVCTGHVTADNRNLSYWATQANTAVIPQDCQGIAYNITVTMLGVANANPNLAQGVLQYDQCDAIFSELALIMPDGQSNAVLSMAPWINPTTLNTNIVVSGGGAEGAWFFLQGNGIL